jgi:type IV secretory pathway TrbF-like protein
MQRTTTVIEAPSAVLSSEDRIGGVAREKAARYKREWEERFSSLLAGRRHWKLICGVLLLINAGEGLGIWNMARTSHTELYVVEKSGAVVNYAGPVKPANMDDATWDVVRVESLKKFIGAWRTVTSDTDAQKLDWDRAFCFVGQGSQARAALAQWYEENDPFKRSDKGEVVTVQFLTFDKEGANTYGLWWRETTTSSSGQVNQVQIWRARIVYATKIPTSEVARAENGLGILATELTWEPVQK